MVSGVSSQIMNPPMEVNQKQPEDNFFKFGHTGPSPKSELRNAVDLKRKITLEEAFEIANKNPKITHFSRCIANVNLDADKTNFDPLGILRYGVYRNIGGSNVKGYHRTFLLNDTIFFGNAESKRELEDAFYWDTFVKKN